MVTAGLELSPGTSVDRRYRIQSVLGRGGFGRTYLAADERRFGELCVLKEFVPNSQGDSVVAQKLRELFQREAATLHQLNHSQIPKFFAGFEEDGRLFIAQEYIDGKTYWRVLQERQQQGRTFTQTEIVLWLRDLLRVLDYLHRQNIVHRDISPDNIMLPRGRKFPVLIDFGVVKHAVPHLHGVSVVDFDGLIQASVSVGKFGYAPYEQIQMGQCSPRSDLYALAVTAVVLLTGKPPNQLINPKSLEWQWHTQVSLDPILVKILTQMMAEKPQNRYSSAIEVLKDLQPLCQPGKVLKAPQVLPHSHPVEEMVGAELDLIASAFRMEASSLQSIHSDGQPSSLPNSASSLLTQITSADFQAATDSLVPTQIEPQQKAEPYADSIGLTQVSLSGLNQLNVAGYSKLPATSASCTAITRVTGSPKSALATQSRAIVLFKQETKPSYVSFKKALIIGFLALLPMGGAVVGVRSPYISSLCWALKNCAGDQQSQERYRQVLEQAASAKTLSEQAQNLSDLQLARNRLVDAIAKLGAFSSKTQIYATAQQGLLNYKNLLQTIEAHLEEETRAAQLLERAEAEAQKAAVQTKVAKTPQTFQAAVLQWRRALATLRAIPDHVFVNGKAAARSQEYTARLEAIGLRLAATQPPSKPEPEVKPTSPQPVSAIASAPQTASPQPVSSESNNPQPSRPRVVIQKIAAQQTSPPPVRILQRGTLRAPQASPFLANSNSTQRSVALSATQTLNDVSIWVDGTRINPDGTFVANLVISNRSDRTFGFVPLFAEATDGNGQAIRSRILFTSSKGSLLEPGNFARGQVFLLDRQLNDAGLPITLVIQESTSGNRTFRIPF